ncbi:hypothetical protein [Nocardia amikacinitolerans]|uniref:hypothetical protein n=1 Tax=Nocardia amikacinitolerans TaxID=756689 RepID=UPI0020A31F70|nr:hypothetical protein [Nocardia amikacinitolerans]
MPSPGHTAAATRPRSGRFRRRQDRRSARALPRRRHRGRLRRVRRNPQLGALPNRIKPLDGDTCTLDLSGDSLPRIAALLTGLDIDYTLDADPAVFDHLATVADRMHRAERPPT